jgi:hypothetical protein
VKYKVLCQMKHYLKILKIFAILTVLLSIHTGSIAQPPPPPPSGGHGGVGNAPPGGGAPVGEGMFILIGLAGLYGGKKIYDARKTLKVKAL